MALGDPLLGGDVEVDDDEPIGIGYEDDGLDDDERRALSAAIAESLEQAARGLVIPASQVLAQLRDRRG